MYHLQDLSPNFGYNDFQRYRCAFLHQTNHFLERILGIKISRIEYPKSQETIDISADAKSVRLDIYVEDGKETVYNIEMQTTENRNLPKRTRYYQGMIDLNILEKGDNYKTPFLILSDRLYRLI